MNPIRSPFDEKVNQWIKVRRGINPLNRLNDLQELNNPKLKSKSKRRKKQRTFNWIKIRIDQSSKVGVLTWKTNALTTNGSRMSRRLGFWKSIVSYFTKITKKSNRPTFHPNPIFGYAMLVVGAPLFKWKRKNPKNQKSESKIWTVQKIQLEQLFNQKSLNINKIEVRTSWRGGKVFVLNSVQSKFDAKSWTSPELGSTN